VSFFGNAVVAGSGDFANQAVGLERAQASGAAVGGFSASCCVELGLRKKVRPQVFVAEAVQQKLAAHHRAGHLGVVPPNGTKPTTGTPRVYVRLVGRFSGCAAQKSREAALSALW